MKIKETSLILKPSKGKGVGIFAIEDIEKGRKLYWDKKLRKISKEKARKNKKLLFMCDTYCVETNTGYDCPLDFQKMSIIWYLNHSKNPNLTMGKTFWSTSRKIKKGEELTINYNDLKEPNKNYIKKFKE